MSTLIKTFDGDIYIIKGKNPTEIKEAIANNDFITMPNGSEISRKSISTMQTYEDYQFQVEQKQRHKKGQFLQNGNWNDMNGYVAPAEIMKILESITETKK